MDFDIEEELNWFPEDPVLTPVQPPKSSSKSKSDSKSRSSKSDGNKSIKRGDNEDEGFAVEVKKIRNDDGMVRYPKDLLGKVAKTPIEKLNLLEERDRLMRIALERDTNVEKGKLSAKGVCPDMCPEKERILRDVRGIVSSHEAYPDTNLMDHSRAVKEYARSSADQEEPLPHELRPAPVLRMTMDYLVNKIMCKIDNNEGENKANWYDFCWGRLRAIRKDIIQQQLCDVDTVSIVEECARFHICCFDRLRGSSKSVFDDKINSETLMNCLKSLMYMYEDLRKQGKACSNEAEFLAYMILLKLHSGYVLSEFQQFSQELRRSPRVREAVDIYTCYSNNFYSSYFMLLKKTSYLNACLMQRFFGHVRSRALEVIVKSHCQPNKNIQLSFSYLAQTLKFDKIEDCITFCLDFGLSLNKDKSCFTVSRNDFYIPETIFIETTSSSLVVNKRAPVSRTVLGFRDVPTMIDHEIHSSFNDDDFLKPGALDASDQEEKMLRDNVERTFRSRKRPVANEEKKELVEDGVKLVEPLIPDIIDDDVIDMPGMDMSPDMPYVDDEEEVVDAKYEGLEDNSSQNTISDLLDEAGRTSFAETDDSDSESLSTTDVESNSQVEPASPFELESSFSSPEPSEDQKTPEVKKMPFAFPPSPSKSSELFNKMSQPFVILSAQQNADIHVEQKLVKKPRSESCKVTQKTKTENENTLLMTKLRKKLSEKMKHVTARKYAQIWKSKVTKIRKSRENECSSVRHITLEDYLQLWGSAQTRSYGKTQERLYKRKKANLLVTALLHLNIIDQLNSEVKAVGDKVAEILGLVSVKWANHYGNIAQPQPVFWKLLLSLPARSPDGTVFPSKLRHWCRTAFYQRINPDVSDVCCWITASGIPIFIHPVIAEGLNEIEKYGQNISAAVLIRADGWEPIRETYERFNAIKKLSDSPVSLAVLTLGDKMELIPFNKCDRDKFAFFQQIWWTDTNAFASSLIQLAKHYHMDNLKMQSLGLLSEISIEKFLDSLFQDQYLNDELSEALTDANYVIKLYNSLLDKLEEELFQCCFYKYYGLACELEPLVKKLKYAHDIFPSNYDSTASFKTALHSHIAGLKLDFFKWDFKDSIGLLSEFREYCDRMGCQHLLSKLFRIINPPDSDSGIELFRYLKDISWLQIVEILAKARLDKKAYHFKVVYREDKIRELSMSHWWLEYK